MAWQGDEVRGKAGQDVRKGAASAPPAALVAAWQAHMPDVFTAASDWVPLSGGQTNTVWKVISGQQVIVVKLFSASGETPLFANNPDAEAVALAALAGTGLAPEMVAILASDAGRSLAYRHVAGRPWRDGDAPERVAQALARLHAHPVPTGLPQSPMGLARLIADIRTMERPHEAVHLHLPESDIPTWTRPAPRCFLHGDPTPANALVTPGGLTFVDWQCPSSGDPADDLAIFLSPAMQIISGNAPMSERLEAAFLRAYAAAISHGAETVARYRAQAPMYHARMAAYAAWRAARGDAAYEPGVDAERARITAAAKARPSQTR